MLLCLCNFFTLRSFAYLLWFQILCFYVLCFLCFFVSCFLFLNFPVCFLKTERERESIELDEWGGGEDLEGDGGGETTIRIHCMIFNKSKEREKKEFLWF